MPPDRPRHIARAFRVTALAVVLGLFLGPVADPLCRSLCDLRSAAASGCHQPGADGQVVAGAVACHRSTPVATALPPDATRRVPALAGGGLTLPSAVPSHLARLVVRPLDAHADLSRGPDRRPRSTVLRI